MKPKKVLYAASTVNHLRAFHTPHLQWLKARGCVVHAVARGCGDGLICDKYIDLPLRKSLFLPVNLTSIARLVKILRRERYDLVVTNTSLAAFAVRLAIIFAQKRNTKTINIVHGYLFDDDVFCLKRMLLLAAERLTAGVTDLIITMNREDTDAAKKYRLSHSGVRQIPGMGVDFSSFQPASAEERLAARAALGIAPESFVLLFAAEFSKRKNQAFLIRALSDLPDYICILMPGSGTLLETAERLARKLAVDGRAFFPGYVEDITPLCHAADICVSSSRIEGLPFFIMEAMSCALPPVVTCVKGHTDLVLDGVTGFLYPFGDVAEFQSAVMRLAENQNLRTELGANAKASVSQFSLAAAATAINAIFAQWLSDGGELC